MRRTTLIRYDDVDVRKIVREEVRKELKNAMPGWARKIIEETTKAMAKYKDEVMTKLDAFVGDIKAKREEQTLHQNQHDEIIETLEKYEKRMHKLEQPAL